jgi:succinyl-CoA synthetase alpha subunit
MIVLGRVRKGAYHDSVALMRVGRELGAMPGVADAALMMGTRSNRAILESSGLLVPEFEHAGDADLLIAVKAANADQAGAALAAADTLLRAAKRPGASAAPGPRDLEGAVEALPGANLALISLAGRYAGPEALKALQRGLHVMLFSDNVPLEVEVRLKKLARSKGLLVMGPDCGTAILNGAPLAFANVVRRGDIGVVAAAGTGLQEVTCLISNRGGGISQAIGTGGRDVKREVGGIMFIEGLRALAADPATRVILLVSKPPDPSVLRAIRRVVRGIRKPVVSLLLGEGRPGRDPVTLEEAALAALALSRGRSVESALRRLAARDAAFGAMARGLRRPRGGRHRYLRGLFSGGTFCAEAQVLLRDVLGELHSNVPGRGVQRLADAWKSRGHTLVDLGDDELTVGRPHPMMDYSLRNRRILEEARDPATAVILLDVVLGYGAHPDPAAELAGPLGEAAKRVAVVCSVTGTAGDPQNRAKVAAALKKAGATVMPTNAAACKLCGEILRERA